MIVTWILNALWGFVSFILRFLPVFPDVNFSAIGNYIYFVFSRGADIFFLFVPYAAFEVALDVVFFFWIYEPLSYFVMWIIKKIPFLGVE